MTDTSIQPNTEVLEALGQAATYRFLCLAFQPPTKEVIARMVQLSHELPESLRETAVALAKQALDAESFLEGAYHQLMGPSGVVRDSELAHQTKAIGGKGIMLADIAGFYRAFGYDPSEEFRVPPDHVAAELGFLGYLSFKEAYAHMCGESEHVDVCKAAQVSFTEDHVTPWLGFFLGQIVTVAGEGYFTELARFCGREVLGSDPEPQEPTVENESKEEFGCAGLGCGVTPGANMPDPSSTNPNRTAPNSTGGGQ